MALSLVCHSDVAVMYQHGKEESQRYKGDVSQMPMPCQCLVIETGRCRHNVTDPNLKERSPKSPFNVIAITIILLLTCDSETDMEPKVSQGKVAEMSSEDVIGITATYHVQ